MNIFLRDTRGNVAILFALATLPLLGLTGAAVDYSRANSVKESLRNFSDQVAVSVASSDNPAASAEILANAENSLRSTVSFELQNIEINGYWLDGANYKFTVNADVPVKILSSVPGMPKHIKTGAVTIVNRIAVVSRIWWKFPGDAFRACEGSASQAARSSVIGSIG